LLDKLDFFPYNAIRTAEELAGQNTPGRGTCHKETEGAKIWQ